jgi:hypothetical protein
MDSDVSIDITWMVALNCCYLDGGVLTVFLSVLDLVPESDG